MKQDLETMIEVLYEICPILKDFFLNLKSSEIKNTQSARFFGYGLILEYQGAYHYTIVASLGNLHLLLERSTFSLGNLAPSNNKINIYLNFAGKEFHTNYSESSCGYARMAFPTSIEA